MSKISEIVAKAIGKPLEELGYELVEVRYAKEYGANTLTIFIDSTDHAIGLDDCERASGAIDSLLDDLDPTNGAPYNLNVSSPGLDRPIKTDRDYERNKGREVEAKLYAPLPGTKTKLVCGVLEGKEGDVVTILNENGYAVELETGQIALLTQRIKFD